MSKEKDAPKDLLQEAHTLLCKRVRDILNDPESTIQELKLAKEFLKDNRIEALPVEGSPLGDVIDAASVRFGVVGDAVTQNLAQPKPNVMNFPTFPCGDVLDEDDPAIDPPTVILGDGRKLG